MKKKFVLCCLVGIMLAFSSCVLMENPSSSSSPSDSSEIVDTHTEHVDADNNGVCDECRESTIRTFDIYALNDLHGKMLDTDSQIGDLVRVRVLQGFTYDVVGERVEEA